MRKLLTSLAVVAVTFSVTVPAGAVPAGSDNQAGEGVPLAQPAPVPLLDQLQTPLWETPPAPPPLPAPPPPAPEPPSPQVGAISAALSKLGAPYVWGASGPNAFDCSGFVRWAYAQVGIDLPHYSGAQYAATMRISAAELQPGDLVFWGAGGSEHVAIYMGDNQLVQTFRPQTGATVTQLAGWWKPPSGYGRVQ